MFRLSSSQLLLISVGLVGAGTSPANTAVRQMEGVPINQLPRGWASGKPGLGPNRPAPAWKNKSWLNANQPVTLQSLRGRVVLLNFWVFTCYNCTNTVPSLVEFDREYRDLGLTVIGIHTPEFPPYAGEHDKANVEQALIKYGIEYPNAQDNDNATWNLYGIQYWPSYVLIDKKGQIRYEGYGEFHVGDSHYREWDERIRKLLAEGT